MHVYIFGNGNLSFEQFLQHYLPVLEGLDGGSNPEFLLCDFRGTDTLVMEYLKTLSARVTVFHVAERPRYLPDKYRTKVSQWKIVGGFSADEARDQAAIDACTHFLACDFNSNEKRTSGTHKNIRRCLELGKTRLGGYGRRGDLRE